MDPQATLAELVQALKEGDNETATDRAQSLDTWLSASGFVPNVDRHSLRVMLWKIRKLLEELCEA